MKPEGLVLNKRMVPVIMHTRIMITYLAPLIARATPFPYRSVMRSNKRLKPAKNRDTQLRLLSLLVGHRSRLQRPSVSDRAVKAERITEMAMVMANCW